MGRIRIGTWHAAALLVSAIVGCAPTGAPISPRDAPAPSTLAQPSPAATATISPVEAVVELQVLCDGTRIDVPAPVVRSQPDGVHLRFLNPSGRELTYAIDGPLGFGMGDSIPAMGGAVVFTFGPGTYDLTCGDYRSSFGVVDPDGLYASPELLCPAQSSGTADHGQDARGVPGSLLGVARSQLRGLRPGDVVEPAGYPQAADSHLIRVVRDGQVVAVLGYADDGHGGWLTGGTRICSGSGVSTVQPAGG